MLIFLSLDEWNLIKQRKSCQSIMSRTPGGHLTPIRIAMLKIRRFSDCLIFNMGNPIPGKTVVILKQGPDRCRWQITWKPSIWLHCGAIVIHSFFSQIPSIDTPYLASEDEIRSIFCELENWLCAASVTAGLYAVSYHIGPCCNKNQLYLLIIYIWAISQTVM